MSWPWCLPRLVQHDAERAAGDLRVLEEQLVEVAHPVEQQAVRIGRLDLDVLRHHRRDAAGLLHGGRGGIRRGAVSRGLVGQLGPGATSASYAGKAGGPLPTSVARSEGRMWTSLEERGRPCQRSHPLESTPHQKRPYPSGRRSAPSTRRKRPTFTDQEALQFHTQGRPGKLEVIADQADGDPARPVAGLFAGRRGAGAGHRREPVAAYDYTDKGNMVAVITNGTAILGLGNRGALAAKPVMEGKAVLFKRFADIDSIDLEVDTGGPGRVHQLRELSRPAFGGINLEDIKAPECFIIEQRLRELHGHSGLP